MGGGRLDVSLLSVYDNIFETLAVSGDKHLGGEDVNLSLVEQFTNTLSDQVPPPFFS